MRILIDNRDIYKALRGRLDLRGYEIVRVQFFNIVAARSVTISKKGIRFSSECIRSLGNTEYVETLVHPAKKTLAVQACSQENRRAMRWAVLQSGTGYSRGISGAAFIETLYELFGLSPEYRYRFRGSVKSSSGENIIEFDLTEPEIIIPERILYPVGWDEGFGTDYYRYAGSLICDEDSGLATQLFYNTEPGIRPTAPEILGAEIDTLIDIMRSPEAAHGTESGDGS